MDNPGYLCADCRRGQPHFDLARSYGIYTGKLRAAILQVKFHGRERLGTMLGRLLMEPWRTLEAASPLARPVLIMPVPLHRSRQRERGYNQAGLLAEGFLRAARARNGAAGVDLAGRCLTRKRSTAPQSGLSLAARSENVRDVFEVAAAERFRGRDVVLVDDVMTTGATASACAAALKRAGAQRVIVLTLARATPQFSGLDL
ncbi:MAG TPA: phosphoribosyltransferase family protein [Terriglobia bacterium]